MNSWPHAPPHRLIEKGTYMITCGTLHKAHLLSNASRLEMFSELLFDCMSVAGWNVQAWAILSNHYHMIASSPDNPDSFRKTISKLHTLSAKELNKLDAESGRKVWFQYYDTHISYQNSYLARLNYVNNNPVHHGVVLTADAYRWCSAAWFSRTASNAFRKTVESFKTDKLSVQDEYEVRAV
jgi:putative transposase